MSSTIARSRSFTPRRWGLIRSKFDQCLTSRKYKNEIQSEIEAGRKLGVIGTPTFFLGRTGNDPDMLKATRQISGAYPYAVFKQAAEQAKPGS